MKQPTILALLSSAALASLAISAGCASSGQGVVTPAAPVAARTADAPVPERAPDGPADGAAAAKPRLDSQRRSSESTDATASKDSDISIGTRKSLRSKILGEERGYLVHTPAGYEHGDASYPVLYLLDGDGHFHHATGIVEFLTQQTRMAPMIVVGVANTDRTRDLTPTRVERFPTSGGADRFLAFLEQELIPRVEQEYRVAPYRVLVGHSFGGLLAIHALNTRPDLFNAYISISASLWWGDGVMVKNTAAMLSARPDMRGKFLYLTVGGEGARMIDPNRAYAEMLRAKAPAGLDWRFEEMPKEDHGSIPHRAIYRGLELLFADWRPPDDIRSVAALERHYQQLSAKFGFEIKVPEITMNLIGYALMGDNKLPEAIAVFRRNVELYPRSANVYDSLGEALEKAGQRALALEQYETAVRKATATNDPLLDTFKENLARARERAPAN